MPNGVVLGIFYRLMQPPVVIFFHKITFLVIVIFGGNNIVLQLNSRMSPIYKILKFIFLRFDWV